MQTDLFEIPVDTTGVQAGNKFAFLERYRFSIRLDQILAATILMIMIYVLVFSFGVEKANVLLWLNFGRNARNVNEWCRN